MAGGRASEGAGQREDRVSNGPANRRCVFRITATVVPFACAQVVETVVNESTAVLNQRKVGTSVVHLSCAGVANGCEGREGLEMATNCSVTFYVSLFCVFSLGRVRPCAPLRISPRRPNHLKLKSIWSRPTRPQNFRSVVD
jgi:hypothetical protein